MFEFSEKSKQLQEQLKAFMDEHIYPNESVYIEQHAQLADRWVSPPILD